MKIWNEIRSKEFGHVAPVLSFQLPSPLPPHPLSPELVAVYPLWKIHWLNPATPKRRADMGITSNGFNWVNFPVSLSIFFFCFYLYPDAAQCSLTQVYFLSFLHFFFPFTVYTKEEKNIDDEIKQYFFFFLVALWRRGRLFTFSQSLVLHWISSFTPNFYKFTRKPATLCKYFFPGNPDCKKRYHENTTQYRAFIFICFQCWLRAEGRIYWHEMGVHEY